MSKKSEEKIMRLAHKILTKTIWPARLNIEGAVDVAIALLESIILSNTEDSDPKDRTRMIEWIEDRFVVAMANLDPDDSDIEPHVWLVEPQGSITEPIAIFWPGSPGDDVKLAICTDLAGIRAEAAATGGRVIEGVTGLAVTDPTWDGAPTVTCTMCDKEHDVHLNVAEALYETAKQQQQQREVSN